MVKHCEKNGIEYKDLITSNIGAATPLGFVAREGNLAMLKYLLELSLDPNVTFECGWTPLLAAARNDNSGCIMALINRGADINTAKKDGFTALHLAPVNYFIDTVLLLLSEGADTTLNINDSCCEKDHRGKTAAQLTGDSRFASLMKDSPIFRTVVFSLKYKYLNMISFCAYLSLSINSL
jgi:ankyrin repeat protein